VKHLSDTNCDIIYLLTSDVTLEESVAIHRQYDAKIHYTFDFSDEELLQHCAFVIERSRFLREECIKYELPYYETARDRMLVFEKIIQSLAMNQKS
jgi:hypothetical protein